MTIVARESHRIYYRTQIEDVVKEEVESLTKDESVSHFFAEFKCDTEVNIID